MNIGRCQKMSWTEFPPGAIMLIGPAKAARFLQTSFWLDYQITKEEPGILHSMELSSTDNGRGTLQGVLALLQNVLTGQEPRPDSAIACRGTPILVPPTPWISQMLLDMALSQMVSRKLSRCRLGYRVKTRNQNARRGREKLYDLPRKVLIHSPWVGIQTICCIEYREGPWSVPRKKWIRLHHYEDEQYF